MVGKQHIKQTKSISLLFCFSGHPRHPQGFNNSGVKEVLGRNPSVRLIKQKSDVIVENLPLMVRSNS